jgi:hypothetical protein
VKRLALLVLLPLSVHADMITPSHNCSKPVNRSQFASEAEQATYRRQVNSYRRCLSDFVNQQNKEARMHSEAARIADNELWPLIWAF